MGAFLKRNYVKNPEKRAINVAISIVHFAKLGWL
jgi:hypothetical protein